MKNNYCFYPIRYFILLLISFIILFNLSVVAQPNELYNNETDSLLFSKSDKTYGLNLAGVYTGSALGLNINPSAFYKFRKNLLAFGPNIQQGDFNFSGVQGYFQHDLASTLRKTMFYYHINLLYHISANLNKVQINNGQTMDQKHNAFEHYAGIGMRKVITEQFYFDSSLGVGAYYTLNDKYVNQMPLRSDNDFSLLIKFGLTYDFKK
ncbi:MAG: hypothetical protein M3Q58_10720 [Bacteroidota bacterium]|nr:hypothetical protein [Bacteroidota bacterium]